MKIMPDDPNYTPLEKALNWASETHHGPKHQERWNQVAAALGADNGYDPMSEKEIRRTWYQFNKNARWTVAMNAIGQSELVEKDKEEMKRYNSDLAMQGNYTAQQWKDRYGTYPVICKVEGYDELTIYDPGAGPGMPNWWLDGPGEPIELWTYNSETRALDFKCKIEVDDPKVVRSEEESTGMTPEEIADFEFRQNLVHGDGPESWVVATVEELPDWYWKLDLWPMNTADVWGRIQIAPGYFCFYDGSGPRGRWSVDAEEEPQVNTPDYEEKDNIDITSNYEEIFEETNRLPPSLIEKLPEMDEPASDQFYKDNRGSSQTWVHQREPAIGPHNVIVMFLNDRPVAKKKSRFDEFAHLPSWTMSQANKYFTQVLGRKYYSRKTIDGYWATVRGYCDPETNEPVALAATEEMEEAERMIDEAIRANDWDEVIKQSELMKSL